MYHEHQFSCFIFIINLYDTNYPYPFYNPEDEFPSGCPFPLVLMVSSIGLERNSGT